MKTFDKSDDWLEIRMGDIKFIVTILPNYQLRIQKEHKMSLSEPIHIIPEASNVIIIE